MSTIVNRGVERAWVAVSTSGDPMTAYNVRQFVDQMDEERIPDDAIVTARRSNEHSGFVGLFVRAEGAAVDAGAIDTDDPAFEDPE